MFSEDTICAIATAPLPAGVAVVRLSGGQAKKALVALCPKFNQAAPREMMFVRLSQNGQVLDEGLAVFFPSPHSFTGEDVVEFHGHGGRAVVAGVMEALLAQHKVRAAEAGEFTRRAVLNGKMDLTAAEGLADLIAAETEAQKKQAQRQLAGELGERFEEWRSKVMHLLAHVEAAIDFPDEELEVLEEAGLKTKLETLIKTLEEALKTNVGQRMRDGFSAVILGRPNAGKSTLTNLLTGKETAIVSPIPGTTRDVVESHLNIGGFPLILADTAGLRQTEDIIEKEGVARASIKAEAADMLIAVVNAEEWPNLDEEAARHLTPQNSLIIVSKVDTHKVDLPAELNGVPVIGLDLTKAESTPLVLAALEKIIGQIYAPARNAATLTRDRHRTCLQSALTYLHNALQLYSQPTQTSLADLMAQDLRDAAAEIGKVTGFTGTEDVLDLVFSTFCIGK